MKRITLLAAFALATITPAFSQSLLPLGDTFVAAGNLNNFSTSPTINVGGAGAYQGLIQFDTTALPAGITGASVAKASLVLFVNKIGTAGPSRHSRSSPIRPTAYRSSRHEFGTAYAACSGTFTVQVF